MSPNACTRVAISRALLEVGLRKGSELRFLQTIPWREVDVCGNFNASPRLRCLTRPVHPWPGGTIIQRPCFPVNFNDEHFRPGIRCTRDHLTRAQLGRNFRHLFPRCPIGRALKGRLRGRRSFASLSGVEMAGLSSLEKEGCRKLLGLLNSEDILALCDTVTNRQVQPANLQDAIHAILVYSQSAEELLKRKKVHRDVIFKYLAKEGVIIPPATEKHNLIQHAKNYWKKEIALKWNETPKPVPVKVPDHKLLPMPQQDQTENVDFHQLGEKFCHWFFDLLNSQNPSLGTPRGGWGPQHFWDDVKLKFFYNTSEQNVTEFQGAEIVSRRLLSLVTEEYLILNPNLDSHGLKCASSPYGLVMVGVAGTVHRGNSCLGIFEKIFGLVRCPLVTSTWKIKFINLRIIGESALASGTPVKPAVTFEQSDLEIFHSVNASFTCEIRLNVRQAIG